MEDKEILDKFSQPETQNFAFDELVRKYQQKIYWHIRKMVIDHEDANDITQDTFVKIWKSLHSFQGGSQLYTWLYRIATNECLTFLEKKKRKNMTSIEDLNMELNQKLDSGYLISGDEVEIKLQKALLTLPDKQRLVFNMKYFDDLSYDEIAEITNTSVGALKASYHIATKKIEEFVLKSVI
ncbi:MAG: RNA polymerase sigma factor [Bacteroidetes bacterium]|nr:MAG: RNA polymerase sigma factor [Bacteroidota bacterium]TAG86071.1 MAG: RNA polymerase sigma factor [Bacteroidota bacterium]